MNNLKLLMKIFFCTFLMTISYSCSSDIDELNEAINADGVNKDSKVSLKINDISYQEYFDSKAPTYQNTHTFKWSKNQYSDGYSLRGYIVYIASATEISLEGPGYITFDIGSDVKQGQVYDVKSSNFDFKISFGGLSNSSYSLQNTTIGQLKITYFDGITMSGEFTFTNVGRWKSDNKKEDAKISGTFTKIEEDKS
ncbi:hypothetical protein [Flavobacterium chilense]|uniref:Lipoprotein n=1 Tax=Flavobacterium chilense TaxID=946677 RepID=A0A1M7CIZ3_9FLAO|nr:hypothetical protein [Flavobacterium chilense]SHL66769.1 hypothetical protein SAMN05444484_102160 [Flavobacterium chilense]